jgi:acetylornithine deacetylase/succinyl-diaminopimelate desuccinylase-like protein
VRTWWLGLLAFSACSVWMPGRSFEGTPPPLTNVEKSLADRLRAHVAMLADEIGERNRPRYERLERARHYIDDELGDAGYIAEDLPYTFQGETFYNVEAHLPAEPPGKLIVIGAHYDSVAGSPGANDNASGVAAMIELARSLRTQPLRQALRFVAFANEEPPYFNSGEGMGSVEYVGRFPDAAAEVAWMMSLETVGSYSDAPGSQHYPAGVGWLFPDRGNFIAFVANPASRSLLRALIARFRDVATLPSEGAALPASIPGIAWSDQRSFWAVGIPAVMVTDTAPFRDAAYHRASDTPEHLDYANMARLVDGLASAVTATLNDH